MASHAPITGAPTRAPKTDARSVSLLATDAQVELLRIGALAAAGNSILDDLAPTDDEHLRRLAGYTVCLFDLIADVAARAGNVCETIEIDARRLEQEGR